MCPLPVTELKEDAEQTLTNFWAVSGIQELKSKYFPVL